MKSPPFLLFEVNQCRVNFLVVNKISQIDKRKRTVTDSLCEFNGGEIIGFVNKASEIFGITKPFFTVKQGAGNNKNETTVEGIIDGNFYGTHIIGPLLIRNKAVAEYFANLLK